MRFLGFCIGFGLLFIRCSNSELDNSNSEFGKIYESVIQQLNSGNVKLKKHITKDGKTDTVLINTVNWQNELKQFTDVEISKSVFDDYEIKSLNGGCEKHFQTLVNKHSVKNYHYSKCNEDLTVDILVKKSNPLYDFDYKLQLTPNGYLIEVVADVDLAYKSNVKIEGKFIKD